MLALLLGCRSEAPQEIVATPSALNPPRVYTPLAPADPWVMETREWNGEYRGTYLGNGRLGQRMMQSGTGMGKEGSLPAYAAGLYEAEQIIAIPSPTALDLRVGERRFGTEGAHVKDYRQSLNMREGILQTEATWDSGAGAIRLNITAFIARHQPFLAGLRVALTPERDVTVQVARPSGAGGFKEPSRTKRGLDGQRLVAVAPSGERFVFQYDRLVVEGVSPAPDTAGDAVSLPLKARQEATITRFTATGWGDKRWEEEVRVQRGFAEPGREGWDAVLDAHRAAWAKLWEADLVIEGNPVEQQIVRSWMFYLLQSVRAGSADSIPPMGLSDTAFGGHIFWDAETWMFPALVLQHPELARSMLEYRYRTLPGAMANAKAEGKQGASFAWESAATGREQTPGGMHSRHGRHVTGDIALAFWQYWLATGDRKWLAERGWPVLTATADYWASRVTPEPGGGFGIRQVATPDENAGIVDNSAWTNYIARRNLEFAAEAARLLGRPAKPRWRQVAQGLKIPRDPSTGMILQSEGYKGLKIKQTDALLLIHPGEMPLSDAEKARLYDYYAEKTIDVGPAMSDSIHAIVAAEIRRAEDAYRYFQDSYQPFLRPPFLFFSEKRTRDNLYFHTGAGGCLQSVLYGFAGLRFRNSPQPTFENPLIPAPWNAIEIRRLRWRGRDWDLRLEKGKPSILGPRGAAEGERGRGGEGERG